MKNNKTYQQFSSFNPLFSVLIFLAVIVGLFYAAQFIYIALLWAAPVILLLTFILDYKVPINFVKLLIAFTRQNLVAGVIFIALSVVFFPVICLFLLGKAFFNKKVKKYNNMEREESENFIPYEEVENEPLITVPRKDAERRYNYDKLFEDA
ncbi:MAG TPA: hypothetical protein VK590_07665 [Saprospiraceae bacterium]|nr:hypothetical protein [Saprospiraceae bacterium]